MSKECRKMIQEKYDQSSIPERRAEKLLGELSLEEKMAQIIY